MTKGDLVSKVAESGNITKKKAEEILNAVAETVKASLQRGEKIVLPGIGSLVCTERKARIGRNPRTGEEVKIPARKTAKFSVSAALADALDKTEKVKTD